MTNAIGTRGKWAESRFKLFLKRQDLAGDTVHHRFPDARAGSFKTAPADFMLLKRGVTRLLEVKEVDHAFRLPHQNFAPDKVARMRMWELAGAICTIIIYHKPINQWRVLPLSRFLERTGGSWDFSKDPVHTEAAAFAWSVN